MTPSWFARAACKNQPSELFWAPKGSPAFSDALRICGECPVASECAAAGRRRHEFGRWGSHYRPGATDEVFVAPVRTRTLSTGVEEAAFVCAGCDFAFRTRRGLQAHLRAVCSGQCRDCAFSSREVCDVWQVENLERQVDALMRDYGAIA